MSLMKTIISFLFILFVFIFSVHSQRLVPSDRVVNHVNVRELPNASSLVVCTLSPGESAELLESISGWHKIRCDNQSEGYVSKAWTKIDDGTSEAEGKDELVIGSWNVKNFATCSRDTLDYKSIADIIETFDVMAIQEVSSNVCTRHLDALKDELSDRGYKYEYLFSEKTGYSHSNPDPDKGPYRERYGFFWDIDRVDLLNPDEPYKFIFEPEMNNPVFRQVPIIADFRVKSAHGFDFQVVSVHTAFNKKLEEVRADEFRFLHKWMNEQTSDPNVTEKNIFIMGDFNANPDGQNNYFDTIIINSTNYRIIFNEPVLAGEKPIKTTIMVPTLDDPLEHQSPVYDHLLLSKQTSYALPLDTLTWASGVIGVIEFDQEQRWQYAGKNPTIKAMSDHRPIWIKLDYDTEDRD